MAESLSSPTPSEGTSTSSDDGKRVRQNELHLASIFAGQTCAVQELHKAYVENLEILKEKKAEKGRLTLIIKELGRETLEFRQKILYEKSEIDREHNKTIDAIAEQIEEYAQEREFYDYTAGVESGVFQTLMGEIEASVRQEILKTGERKEIYEEESSDREISDMFDSRSMTFETIRLAYIIRQAANQGHCAALNAFFASRRASSSIALTQRLRRLRAMQREVAVRAEQQRSEEIRMARKVDYIATLGAMKERIEAVRTERMRAVDSEKEQVAALKDEIALMREEIRQLSIRRKAAVRAAMETIESNEGFENMSNKYSQLKMQYARVHAECEKYREAIRFMATQIGAYESTIDCRTSPDAKRVGKLLTEQILRKQQLQADQFVREYLESNGITAVSSATPDKRSTSPRTTPSALAAPSDLGDLLHDANAGRASLVVRPSDPSYESPRALVGSDVEIGHVASKKTSSLTAIPVGLFDDHTASPAVDHVIRPSEPSHESFERLVHFDAEIGHGSPHVASSHIVTSPNELRSLDAGSADRLKPSDPYRIENTMRGIEAVTRATAELSRVRVVAASPTRMMASSEGTLEADRIVASRPAAESFDGFESGAEE